MCERCQGTHRDLISLGMQGGRRYDALKTAHGEGLMIGNSVD
jgi:hypothetical protein